MSLFQLTWLLPMVLACAASKNLIAKYEWKYIEFHWKNDEQKQEAINNKEYDKTTIIPTHFQPLKDGRIIISTPRYNITPATLSTICNQTGDGGPLLCPFPDWSWHKLGDCSGITSVGRVLLDAYGKLWLVDSGKIGNKQVCPAKILQFDVKTNELLLQVRIPDELTHNPDDKTKGRLEIQAVEMPSDSYKDYTVFISDVDGFGLVIWDGIDIWRLDDDVYNPMLGAELFSINGENVTIQGGPQGVLLTPPGFLNQTYLIFKPLSTFVTSAATTEDLRNSKLGHKVRYFRSNFTARSQEPGKCFAKNNGVLIAGFTAETAIVCWNIQNPLEWDSVAVLETNSTTLQYISDIKITDNKNGKEQVWVLSNKRHKYLLGTMNFEEINYRILQAFLNPLIAGTVCEPRAHNNSESIEDKLFYHLKTS